MIRRPVSRRRGEKAAAPPLRHGGAEGEGDRDRPLVSGFTRPSAGHGAAAALPVSAAHDVPRGGACDGSGPKFRVFGPQSKDSDSGP